MAFALTDDGRLGDTDGVQLTGDRRTWLKGATLCGPCHDTVRFETMALLHLVNEHGMCVPVLPSSQTLAVC